MRILIPRGLDGSALGTALGGTDREIIRCSSFARALEGLVAGSAEVAVVSPLAAVQSSAEWARVEGVGLAAEENAGCPFMKLLLFARVENCERAADTTDGHLASILAQVVFRSMGRSDITFEGGDVEPDDALGAYDAVVTCGDTALLEEDPEECTPIDLGRAWSALSRSPSVWGVLVARRDAVGESGANALRDAAASMEAQALAALIDDTCEQTGASAALISGVLNHLSVSLADAHVSSLSTLVDAIEKLGIECPAESEWAARLPAI